MDLGATCELRANGARQTTGSIVRERVQQHVFESELHAKERGRPLLFGSRVRGFYEAKGVPIRQLETFSAASSVLERWESTLVGLTTFYVQAFVSEFRVRK